jgi:cell wall-associated NlpC family hydrolase
MNKLAAAVGATISLIIAFVLLAAVLLGGSLGTGVTSDPGIGTTLQPGKVPAAYAGSIQRAGSTCSAVSAPLLAAQLDAESGFNPRAVSPAGAKGLAQFLPATWARWGRDGDGDGNADPFSPADAIATQAAYDCALADQLTAAQRAGQVTGGTTSLMLAAYNAGLGAVLAAHGLPHIPETQAYVTRITSAAGAFAADTGQQLPAGGFAARLIAAARSQLGVPYVWGGGGPAGPTNGGFDCSGLVLYAAYQASGGALLLPHFADTQTRTGIPVRPNKLQPGDAISFTRPGETIAHHIGIYLGDHTMIHAPETGSTVSLADISGSYWTSQQWRATRYG